jgi:hypothetical protein
MRILLGCKTATNSVISSNLYENDSSKKKPKKRNRLKNDL